MATNSDVLVILNDTSTSDEIGINKLSITKSQNDDSTKEKIYGGIFLTAVTGISAIIGFGTTLSAARKQDPKFFEEGVIGVKSNTAARAESGASLALRALGWGSVYAIGGCGLIVYGIWKLSGANNFQEFRFKMASILPTIPKNYPPQSRTEFDGLTDLLTYVSEDWGKTGPESTK
ncbi:transmembrane protein 242 [Venturia canescens]|uniref:transmembrane protein 242 n=1 Tax=Venturia canescens TaxID=32260 RepID=UPI001C9BE8BD|nr:transmembrane protein 242 [Venturia canescens]